MIITGEIDLSGSSHLSTSGGFADIKPGIYEGSTVAVKTLKVVETSSFEKVKNARGGEGRRNGVDTALQQFCEEAII